MNVSSLELYHGAQDWALDAPRRGASGQTDWRAGYLVVEKDMYIDMAISYTKYGEGEPEFDTKKRRVEWSELRTLMDTFRTVRASLTAVLFELFEECGIGPSGLVE